MSAPPRLGGPLWLVGCGNMGGAMLAGWRRAGLDLAQVTVIRPSGTPIDGVRVLRDYPLDEVPAVAVLAMKPQQLDAAAPALARVLDPATILVSILAGVRLVALRQRFPDQRAIVRAMPNTPVAIGRGATALAGEGPGAAQVEALMATLGRVEWIDDEGLFDAVSALTASGPAFVFRFIDALAAGAAALGLPADQAARLATAMVDGAAGLAAASDESPGTLADRVASPGGMTRAGLDVLDAEHRLAALVAETLAAATQRSRQMGTEAAAAPR